MALVRFNIGYCLWIDCLANDRVPLNGLGFVPRVAGTTQEGTDPQKQSL